MKKKLSMFLAASMMISCLAGCGGTNGAAAPSGSGDSGSASSGEIEEVVMLYPGEETDAMENFIDNQLNPRLNEEVGINLKLIYKGWDQYWEQKEVMLSAGETVDLYWDGMSDLATRVNKTQCQPLDDLIKENCQDMLKVIPESQMAGGVVNGVQYGIPSAYAPSSCMLQFVCLRQDILEKVGMTEVKTPEDLREFAKRSAEQCPDMKGPADVIFKPLTRAFEDEQYTWCAYAESVVYGEETHKAYSYFETDAFKKVAEFNRSMYEQGLYREELTTKYSEREYRLQQGTYLWVEGSLGKENEQIGAVRQNAPDAVLKSYILNPEADKYITACGGECLQIPYCAKNPAGALKFVNWLYKNQENYLFCLYGPEGENYTIENDRLVLKDPAFEGYFYEWMFRNANYTIFPSDVSDEFIEMYTHWDDDAKTSDVIAFHFDNSNVLEIETNVNEVLQNRLGPILYGYVDFDENYPVALQELKDAGIDEYVAEVQRQLDEYFAVNGHQH